MDEGALQLHEGALQLQDNADHVVRIASSEISCVRIGHFDAKYRSYHLRIWRDIDEKPFEPILVKQSWAAYRETITEFAGVLARANRLDRLDPAEPGTSRFDALVGPASMLVPTLGALALALLC